MGKHGEQLASFTYESIPQIQSILIVKRIMNESHLLITSRIVNKTLFAPFCHVYHSPAPN